MRSNDTLQQPGSMHWKRLTLGEWVGFGFLWFASIYSTGLFLTPGTQEAVILFLTPIFGEGAVLVGTLLWIALLLGFVGFAVCIPGMILHNSIKYTGKETPQGVGG